MAHAGGRPPKLNEQERQEVYDALLEYIRKEDDPTMAGFVSSDETAMQYLVTRDNLNDWSEFSTLITKAVQKQEAYLLKQGGSGKYNPTIAIFRLKQPQHGYTDRQQIDAKVEQVQPIISLEDNAVHRNDSNQED